MKQKLLIFFLFGLFALQNAFAQNRKITGTVTGSDDGKSLPGVSIRVTGTTIGTQTNIQGDYSINIPPNARSLTFTYIGFTTKAVEIGTANVYNVRLTSDNKTLNEIVVTGYGVQKKSELTGSIVSIKAAQIEDRPVQTFDKALQGRVAGVQLTSNSGQPGAAMDVRIRGTATINGSTQPLYIIDGVQVNTGTVNGSTSGSTSVNALSSINPDDIESIEIIKDAGSAAIYGSLAGNGVVIVTTKRGKVGKTVISASAQFGRNNNYNPYKTLSGDDFYMLQREAYENYRQRLGEAPGAGTILVNQALFGTTTRPATIPYYDWVSAINSTGHVSQYDLSANGGDAKTKFFISGSYNNTDGTIFRSNFKRGTFRSNIEHKASDKFSISSSLSVSGTSSVGPSTNQGLFVNAAFTGALLTAPINPIYNPDGTFNSSLRGINSTNEVQYLTLEQTSSGVFQTVDNLALTYNILPELSFKVFGGLDFSDIRDFNYRPSSLPSAASVLGSGSETFRRNINYNTNGTFYFTKKIANDHNLSALAGFEYRALSQRVLSASAQGFPSPLLNLVSNASTPTAAVSTFTGFKTAGFFGQIKYDYKGKYLFTANARNDGSSRFGANSKFGLFYGFTGGWNIMAEDFMKDANFISQFKPRVSYGLTGTQPTGNFTSLALYGNGGQYGNPLLGGLRPTQLPNQNLSWEKSASIDLGLDIGVLNNRISLSADVYRRRNSDLILDVTEPGDSGFTGYTQNAGVAKSEGIEFDLNTINLDTKGFKWTTNFNIAFNRNKLLSLVNGLDNINTYQYTVGMGLNNYYTYKYAGVNPADGRPMYYDINNNITYSPKTTDRRIIGNTNPRVYGGFDNTFSYKGMSLDVLFQYQYGNYSNLAGSGYFESSGSTANNQLVSQLDRWTTPGQITWVARPYSNLTEPGSALGFTSTSSRYIQEVAYIRLKQVNLSYTLPKSFLNKIKIPSASVFLQSYNLVTITNYRGDDPENTGSNLNFYPNPRTLTAGINVKF